MESRIKAHKNIQPTAQANTQDNAHVVLHLSLIPGIGPATIEKLVEQLRKAAPDQDLEQLYTLTRSDFSQLFSLSPRLAHELVQGLHDKKLLERELDLIGRFNISWTTSFSSDYPMLLHQIHLPPPVIYWQGKHPTLYAQSLAVVGSRKAHAYATRVAQRLLPPLVEQGWCIVSGGARGADTIAHSVALAHNGSTVAIIGSGLLKPYPAQNKALFDVIIEKEGTLLSPFPLQTPAQPGNFPARNRIIAGLGKACIVLQAAAKSGALITAFYALEQGREVCAVPGPIDDELSAGCHALIAQGAHIVTTPDDIFTVLGCAHARPQVNLKLPEVEPSEEDFLLGLCKAPTAFDELLEKTNLEPAQLHEKLFDLQLQGKIAQSFNGLWYAI
jgi:DNA processing protein